MSPITFITPELVRLWVFGGCWLIVCGMAFVVGFVLGSSSGRFK